MGSNSSFRHVYRVGVGVTRTEPTASHGETFGFLQGGSADSVSLAIGLMSYQARRTGFDRARSPGARHLEKLSPGESGLSPTTRKVMWLGSVQLTRPTMGGLLSGTSVRMPPPKFEVPENCWV